MPISEKDISILIPTYRYRDKVVRAVESALASGADEIIVTDDHSGDGTIEALSGYDDPRLRVYENATNLGLWENHLAALGHATRPWIKFIQADDHLLPGGLAAYAAAADPGVSVVWGCAIVQDAKSGRTYQINDLSRPRRLSGEALLNLCIGVGWLLGSPSHMMVRADALVRDPGAWITDVSADLLMGTIAAAQGDVALMPPGAIAQENHGRQDAQTQGRRRALRRLVASVGYLQSRPERCLQRYATLWAAMNRRITTRSAAIGALRGEVPPVEAFGYVRTLNAQSKAAFSDPASRATIATARTYRKNLIQPRDIDAAIDFFASIDAGSKGQILPAD